MLGKNPAQFYLASMGTLNISLPDALKSFVDEQVAASPPTAVVDEAYFGSLRNRVHQAKAK